MGFLIHCILLLVIPGYVFAAEVVNGILRRSVYLNVSISDEKLLFQWNFKSGPIASRIPGFPPGCIGSYIGRCEMYDNGALKLDNLTSTDEGIYTFTAQQPPAIIVKEVMYDLKVYPVLDAPVLSKNDTSNNLIGGTYVSLHCNASGQTVTTYTFDRDGNNICSQPNVTCRDSYLYFQPIKGSDSGHYTCTIQNPVSSNYSRNSLLLNVTDPVSDVKLSSNTTVLVWPGLDSVYLNCSARGTNVNYLWYLEGKQVPQVPPYYLTENNRVLTISPISANDNGTFTCRASNSINSQNSSGINFNLAKNVSEVTLTANTSGSHIWVGEDSVSLHCSADGSDVTFLWKLNGELLPPGSQYNKSEGVSPPHSNLLISPISKNDAGPFTCEASNRLGSKISNALNFNLAWNPEKGISCTATSEGKSITLGCSWSGGHPAANVSLTFKGETNNQTNNVTRLVSIVGNFEGSDLKCRGDQLGRISQCTLPIGPPVAIEHNNKTTVTNVGGTLNLTVTLQPALPANFTWYTPSSQSKASQVTSTNFSSTYQIQGVTEKDAGTYNCKAENIIGEQSFFFTVKVDATPANDHLSGGAIAGIVIGVLAGVALIGIALFFIVRQK